MTTPTNLSVRRYDLDWLRVFAIIIVLYFHVGMIFNKWDFHLKSAETSGAFSYVMAWLHNWRMPLLLFISGAGTIFATSKRSICQIFGERNKRLMIPLVFSMLVIVPPQIYIERINAYAGYFDFYPTVFQFIPYPEGGSLSWHHMWFVLYLFLYTVISLPLIKYLRSPRSGIFIKYFEKLFALKYGFFLYFALVVASQFLLRPYWPDETHGLFDDWAYFFQYFSFFLAGMLITSSGKTWESLKTNRRFYLLCGVVSYAYMIVMWHINWDNLPLNIDALRLIYDINNVMMGFVWVFAIAGYGYQYLNKNHGYLKIMNEGIYPFYILHQTVLMATGFYIMQIIPGVWPGFFTVSAISLIVTVFIYAAFIRPFNAARFLFGMKPKQPGDEKITELIFTALRRRIAEKRKLIA